MDPSFLSKLNKEISEKIPLLEPIVSVTADGNVNRFDSTKKGDSALWVCVHYNEFKGNGYYNAVYGSWREGVQYTSTSYGDRGEKPSKEYQSGVKKQLKATKDNLEREKQAKYKDCREKWEPYFYNLPSDGLAHEYLKRKKINSNYIARVTNKDVLFVPAYNSDGVFVGGQRIFFDPEKNKFEKRYTYGIEKKGSFVPFGPLRTAEIVYVCEGFATACSVYRAFKNKDSVAVVAIFDTSNLLDGALAIRRVNPNSYLVFAADHDTHTDPKIDNIGERKAIFAANKLNNAIVKKVKFSSNGGNWSDFNDLHQFEGLDQVIKQLYTETTEFTEIIPLGFNDKKYYYFSTCKKNILELSASEHNPSNLSMEAPAKYWGDRYGYVLNKEMEKTNNPNWKKVIEKLGIESARVGQFNPSRIRGVGAWEHDGKLLLNLGDKLFYKGEFYPLFNNGLKSSHFYQSGQPLTLDLKDPLTSVEALKFVEAFKMLKYKNPSDYIIILGWIFSAQIFAALPWRPHLWITGERGSGKSTILNYINDAIELSILTQDSTASGIRQRILNDALPVISDESEPETEKDRMKLKEVLLLARQSSTRSSYETLRGSASGKSVSYNTNTTFCMGSVQLSAMGGADTSRFFVVEMESIKEQSPSEFIRLENAMIDISRLNKKLFVRAVLMYENHVKNIELAKKVIKEKKIESRQADQLAPIIAGYYGFYNDDVMSEGFVLNTIKELNFENSDYAESNKINDSEKCLDDILGLVIHSHNMSVGQIIQTVRSNNNFALKETCEKSLGLIGLKYIENEDVLFIPGRSSALKSQMERVSDFSDYFNVLKRHLKYKDARKVRIGASNVSGITIKLGA